VHFFETTIDLPQAPTPLLLDFFVVTFPGVKLDPRPQ
jgi:hypothetical protein